MDAKVRELTLISIVACFAVPCSSSYRPFQAPRTQSTEQRHSWRRLRSAISPLLRRASLVRLIEAYVKALEATDFAERLIKLERMTNR